MAAAWPGLLAACFAANNMVTKNAFVDLRYGRISLLRQPGAGRYNIVYLYLYLLCGCRARAAPAVLRFDELPALCWELQLTGIPRSLSAFSAALRAALLCGILLCLTLLAFVM